MTQDGKTTIARTHRRRVLKWAVPVDDRDHPIGSGPVVLVDCQNERRDVVQVWTDEADADDVTIRSARVYGTGQPVPPDDEHLGSVVAEPLVWHVFASHGAAPSALRVVTEDGQ